MNQFWIKVLAVPLLAAGLVSCPKDAVTGITATASPTTIASGATSSLSATVSGTGAFSPAVNWSVISGGGTLSSTSGSSVTYTAPTVTADIAVQIKATAAGDSSVSKTLTLTVQPPTSPPASITVTGKVLSYSGQPVAFLPVLVGSKVTSSDANGNFSANEITSPYQLVIVQTDQKFAQVYQGVTRPDPIVLVAVSSSSPEKKSTVTVSFTGTGTGYGLMDIAPYATNLNGGATGSVGTPGTSYTTDLRWKEPTSLQANICAMLYQNTDGVATTINAFGQTDGVSIQDGQTPNFNVIMKPVPTKIITGSVTAPAGFAVNYKVLGFVCGSKTLNRSYPFTFDKSAATSFSYVTPVTTNSLYVTALATQGEASVYIQQFGVAPDASGINLVLPQPMLLNSPANNAVGINASTSFSWSPTTVGASQMSLTPSSPGPLSFSIITSGASATVPDLSAIGYPLPKGVKYNWLVRADSLQPTVNDILSGVPPDPKSSASGSYSGVRTLTTTP